MFSCQSLWPRIFISYLPSPNPPDYLLIGDEQSSQQNHVFFFCNSSLWIILSNQAVRRPPFSWSFKHVTNFFWRGCVEMLRGWFSISPTSLMDNVTSFEDPVYGGFSSLYGRQEHVFTQS
ncbi:hypothetical protein POPTR_014G092050v4 [Populus trichocarpa]|uniref:Uncharacterized protein n=1 Tax=Populus trichocarpa TaxID=3694 RepID=A0A3N7HQC4_POPTR|nr:hypothetical protein POPTR_014G092050v4 [Populus trichocarpa]RQO99943.1 hypothetical protein POPTR_014G092050v4 [Populus trichocarpa]RQO99944.1 hypothetical protein POPTR_014G092050v4 [Populus trichocarpa]